MNAKKGMMIGWILGGLVALGTIPFIPFSKPPIFVLIPLGIIVGAMGVGALLGRLYEAR